MRGGVLLAVLLVATKAQQCSDDSSGVILGEGRYTCASTAPWCNSVTYGCKVSMACPATCSACDRCDVEGATTFSLADVAATCQMLSPYCSHPTYGASIRAACPQSCSCGMCLRPPPLPPERPPVPPAPPAPPAPPPGKAPPSPKLPLVACEDSSGCSSITQPSCEYSTANGCSISGACPVTCGKCAACDAEESPSILSPPQSCAEMANAGWWPSIPPNPIPCHPISSHAIRCYRMPSYPMPCHLIPSHPIPSHLVLSDMGPS